MNNLVYDSIVIGAGPAGISASIYLYRFNKKILLISKNFGGSINTSLKVDNYPGFFNIDGETLTQHMKKHIEYLGVSYINQTVTYIKHVYYDHMMMFKVITEDNTYLTKTILLTMGCQYIPLSDQMVIDHEVEKDFKYCATCDGLFFRNKDVVIIGGGNTALYSTSVLSDMCKSITVLNKNSKIKNADEILLKECINKPNVSIKYNIQLSSIYNKENEVESSSSFATKFAENNKVINYIDTQSNVSEQIICQGIFINLGQKVFMFDNDFKTPLLQYENGEIIVDHNLSTNIPGLYAAGDVISKIKQYVVATGDGCTAAFSIREYLNSTKNNI